MEDDFSDHSVNRKVVDNVENYLNMQLQPKLMQEISAKNFHAFLKKCQKTSCFDKKLLIKKISDFSAKIGLRHFSTLITGQHVAKNQKKVMTGSMRTFITDGQTDGPGYIGPEVGPKNNNIERR